MASIEAPEIRPIGIDDCEGVWPLSIEAGWNQNLADWRFMLGAGRGFGCADANGQWQASSLIMAGKQTATPLARSLYADVYSHSLA